MESQLRPLGEDRDVRINYTPSETRHTLPYRRQQRDTIGVLVARIAIWELPPEIALTGRSEDRVGESVGGDVCVGMTSKAMSVRDRHAAEHQSASRFQRMEI